MIIAFYPGAGGNRYFLSLKGQKEFNSNIIYDTDTFGCPAGYRYLDDSTQGFPDRDVILTHCVNVPLLKKHFPTQDNIVVIVGDYQKCLRREWALSEQHKDKDLDNKFEHAHSHVAFHNKYYAQLPLDTTGATTVIDIDKDHTEFTLMMRRELDLSVSEVYDRAVVAYNKLVPGNFEDLPGDKIVEGFKSKFLDDAEQMKLRLDAISPSLCLAKWKQVSLHLATGMNNSCYHPPLHRIPVESIKHNPSALHNTDHKKEQRRLMLNGERPAECSYCWAMEDNGKLSDRHYRSGEPWAAIDFGKIVSSEYTDDIIPSYVEVNFNNACNLKCSYCSPQFSSSWQAEMERHGAFPTSNPHNAPEHFAGDRKPIPNRDDNPYVDAFWRWWPDLYPKLQHFRMTGGEPLMDRNTYRVFDYVLALPKPDLHLNVTSNLSVDPPLWNRYFDYVKKLCNSNIEHFMQYVSLDSGIPEQAEYIRDGMDFYRVKSRVNHFLHDIPNRNSLTFIITMNNLSVSGLQKQLEWILDLRKQHSTTYQRVWFDTPVLRQPLWQSLQILPESYVSKLEQARDFMSANLETSDTRFHGFKDYEVQRLDRDIAWMRNGQHMDPVQLSTARSDFYRFFSEHDRRRGTDFLATFPEMTSWWKECEYYAKQS